jgi:predicted transcriptional regulator
MSNTKTNPTLGQENIIEAIKKRATAVGVSMNRICREIGVDQSKITRWKKKEPSSITYLRKIDKYLAEKEASL